jgi:bifunctional pyridoxal-dependent enzyme with beta-cystathionase and maltose regulon repressor activities
MSFFPALREGNGSDHPSACRAPENELMLSARAMDEDLMEEDPEELVTDLLDVESVEQLRLRRSVKWRLFPDDVLPLISPPVYPPFFGWAPEAGVRILEAPLVEREQGWRLDLVALERAFATHPAVYVLCNPHNPVGRVHEPEELAALVRLARIYGVTIISDEIHAPLVLTGAAFTPLLTVPGAADVAIRVMSAS